MKMYLVGGAVRDALMAPALTAAQPAHVDRDWVVVGGTPQAMQDLGYLPVGRDFPVFLHPKTHEEYALARTERKTAPGYHGFAFHAAPGVTLHEDLARRDLTITRWRWQRKTQTTRRRQLWSIRSVARPICAIVCCAT